MLISLSSALFKQTCGAGFNAAVSLALVLWLARVMGVDSFGHYVAVLSGTSVGLILLEGGWASWLYRESSTRGEEHLVMGHGVAHIISLGGLAIITSLVMLALGLITQTWAFAWVCMTIVALMNLVSARLRGWGWFGREALWQATGRLVSALNIVVCVTVLSQPTANTVFAAWALGLALVVLPTARRCLVRPRWVGLHGSYSKVLPFVLMSGCMAWMLKGDMVLLGWWMGERSYSDDVQTLSLYAACTRLTEMGLLLFAPLGNILLRGFVVSPFQSGALQRTEQLLWRVLMWLWAIGAVTVCLAFVWGERLMEVMFGTSYRSAGALLPWVLLMLPAACGNLVWLQWWSARHSEGIAAQLLVLAGVLLAVAVPTGAHFGGATWAAVTVAMVHACLWLVFASLFLWQRRARRAPA